MAQSPCFLLFPFWSLFASLLFLFTYLETLLAVIGSHPPWSQVARKLISPFPSPPHSLPIPKSRPPGVSWAKCALTKTTSQNWLTSPEHFLTIQVYMFPTEQVWYFPGHPILILSQSPKFYPFPTNQVFSFQNQTSCILFQLTKFNLSQTTKAGPFQTAKSGVLSQPYMSDPLPAKQVFSFPALNYSFSTQEHLIHSIALPKDSLHNNSLCTYMCLRNC